VAFAFEKLLVYQKAVTFADQVCTIIRDLSRGFFFLSNQLNRAAPSINLLSRQPRQLRFHRVKHVTDHQRPA